MKKRRYQCGKCGLEGHQARTCPGGSQKIDAAAAAAAPLPAAEASPSPAIAPTAPAAQAGGLEGDSFPGALAGGPASAEGGGPAEGEASGAGAGAGPQSAADAAAAAKMRAALIQMLEIPAAQVSLGAVNMVRKRKGLQKILLDVELDDAGAPHLTGRCKMLGHQAADFGLDTLERYSPATQIDPYWIKGLMLALTLGGLAMADDGPAEAPGGMLGGAAEGAAS